MKRKDWTAKPLGIVGIRTPAGAVDIDFSEVESNFFALVAENERLRNLVDRLRQEAQINSGEARCHKSTVHEIYQLLTAATGEPATWNGALPVRRFVACVDRLSAIVKRIDNAVSYGKQFIRDGKLHTELKQAHEELAKARRCEFAPTTAAEREAVMVSLAHPKELVLIVYWTQPKCTYVYRQSEIVEENIRDGYVVAKFRNGKLLKEG